MNEYRLGIDLGGTKIEGVILDCAGKELLRKRIETQQEKGYESILGRIRELYHVLTSQISSKPHTLGIGTPGAISFRTGLLKNSNTVCMNGKPLKADLQKVLGRDFAVQNDANCFAMAEAMMGAGKGKARVFGVIMGTGCGGGIVHEGKVVTGLQSIAGEWGHMSIDPHGPECYCGSRGCVETFISGGGLEKRYAKENGESLPLKEIVTRYRADEERASAFMELFFCHFGRAMANLINILDPDGVVLGGGVSNIEEIYTHGVHAVQACVFSDSLETPILRNQLGDSAGVIGAALIGI
jgi:fructokinase